MKLSRGAALFSLVYSASAASKAGHVYIYDPVATNNAPVPSQVSPETLRLILAQRLDVSSFHSIENPTDEAIAQLNAYGGRQQKLFGSQEVDETAARVLVWIEDVEDAKAIISDSSVYSADFSIASPPSRSANDRLVQDMISQAESLPTKKDPRGRTHSDGISIEELLKPVKTVDTHNDYLTVFRASKNDKLSATKLSEALAKLLSTSVESKEQGWPITVVLMPPSTNNKRELVEDYGSYHIAPATDARQQEPEALLSLLSPSASQPSESPFSDVPDLESFPHITEAKKGPVRGILPRCFETEQKCISSTNNCSDHGECKLTGKGTGGSTGRLDCYSCVCVPTVKFTDGKGMEEKKTTTYWGGPACQKKDISIPFWMFVFTGVFLAFLISSGIGMMYSMGSEELPSVIGAGVSGPPKK